MPANVSDTIDKKTEQWLKQEVIGWKNKNIISEFQTKEILDQYSINYELPKKEPLNVIKVLSIIGAIILGLGIILFVASHWQEIPKLSKIILLFAITFSTLYFAYYFSYQNEKHPALGKSLFLLAALFYGATLLLLAQIYHTNANAHWLVLFWAVSLLPIIYFFDSLPVYILTMLLFIIWDILFAIENHTANYAYPAIVFLLLLPYIRHYITQRENSPQSSQKEIFYTLPILVALGIAQITAVVQKFHWLILLWSLGCLVYYFITKKQLYIILFAATQIVWIISFFTVYDKLPNYWFIAPFVFLLYISYTEKYPAVFVLSIVGFLVWINLFIAAVAEMLLFTNIQFVAFLLLWMGSGLLFYVLGLYHVKLQKQDFAAILRIIGFIIIVIVTYLLSFKSFLNEFTHNDFSPYFFAAALFLLLAVGIAVLNAFSGIFASKERKLELTVVLLAIVFASFLLLFPQLNYLHLIFMNILFFIVAIITVLYGFETKNPALFNIGIVLFVLFIVTRYFDLFWQLLPRSLFFIIGGTIMIIGSIVLENRRRKTIEQMKSDK